MCVSATAATATAGTTAATSKCPSALTEDTTAGSFKCLNSTRGFVRCFYGYKSVSGMCVPATAATATAPTTAAISHCPAGTKSYTSGVPLCNYTTAPYSFAQCWYGFKKVSGMCVPVTAATTAATSKCPLWLVPDITIANHACNYTSGQFSRC